MGRAQRLRTHPFPVPVFWQLVSRLLRSFGVHHSPKKSDPGMSKARCLLTRASLTYYSVFYRVTLLSFVVSLTIAPLP